MGQRKKKTRLIEVERLEEPSPEVAFCLDRTPPPEVGIDENERICPLGIVADRESRHGERTMNALGRIMFCRTPVTGINADGGRNVGSGGTRPSRKSCVFILPFHPVRL